MVCCLPTSAMCSRPSRTSRLPIFASRVVSEFVFGRHGCSCAPTMAGFSTRVRAKSAAVSTSALARRFETSSAATVSLQFYILVCGEGVNMCDQDHFEQDRLDYDARGLVTRRQFGVLVGAGITMML